MNEIATLVGIILGQNNCAYKSARDKLKKCWKFNWKRMEKRTENLGQESASTVN